MKNKITMSMKPFFAAFILSAFLFSCDHMNDVDDVVDDIKEEQKARAFKAELRPLNNSGVTGTATFQYLTNTKKDGKFESHIMAKNLAPNMVHPQHIHGFGFEMKNPENAVCPPQSAAGDDGLLTLEDGLPFYGPVLVPLDSKLVPLSVQEFPTANAHGQVNYLEFTALHSLLMAIDESTEGHQTLENLSLNRRTVVLHGAWVKDNMVVPAGTEGAEYIATLPVACGEIREVF
jgi:hypothetical protein